MEDTPYQSLSANNSVVTPRTIYPVNEFVKLPEFSFLTKSSVRHMLFNSKDRYSASGDMIAGNGLVKAGAVIRIGRKVLIDIVKFREWLYAKSKEVQQ